MSFNTSSHETSGGGISGILYIIKGMVFSFILSLLLILPAAVILKAFMPKDGAILAAALIISLISTIFSGFYTSRHVLKSGLLNGALAGILYFLILFLIGSLVSRGVHFSPLTAIALGISLAGGGLGGVFGINSIKPARRR